MLSSLEGRGAILNGQSLILHIQYHHGPGMCRSDVDPKQWGLKDCEYIYTPPIFHTNVACMFVIGFHVSPPQ